MTSPSRKSRRITAWTTAILTSLAATSSAQPPKAGPDAPAPTTWQQYTPPVAKPAPATPTPEATMPELPPLPQPPKIVTYQKPAHDAKPLPVMRPREAMSPVTAQPIPRYVPAVPAPVSVPTCAVPRTPTEPPVQTAPVVAKPAMMARPLPAEPVAVIPQPPVRSETKPIGGTLGTLPSRTQLFRLDSDAVLNDRIRTDLGPEKSGDKFPTAQPLVPAQTKYEPKTVNYSPSVLLREPNYVVHRRLYFEEMNGERAGWDAGPAQGLISSYYFYRDVVLFPCKFASGCRTPYDASSGKCMPGDPTPYYCYPPSDLTLFGGTAGAAFITGVAFIFP